jgi:hypothetical protein
MTYDELIQKMASEMLERKAHEKRINYDLIDAAKFLEQCRAISKPYYWGDGQFSGGFSTERYVHPIDPDRKIAFEWEDDELIMCYTWVQYKDFPYPI